MTFEEKRRASSRNGRRSGTRDSELAMTLFSSTTWRAGERGVAGTIADQLPFRLDLATTLLSSSFGSGALHTLRLLRRRRVAPFRKFS
jgi:hypothetical protein